MKNQEDEERGVGVCPERGGEEEFPRTIRRWSEEIDMLFFACVFKFER